MSPGHILPSCADIFRPGDRTWRNRGGPYTQVEQWFASASSQSHVVESFPPSSRAGARRGVRWSTADCSGCSTSARQRRRRRRQRCRPSRAAGVRLWKTTFAWPRRLTAPLAVSSTLGRAGHAPSRWQRGAADRGSPDTHLGRQSKARPLHAPPAGRCGCATAERPGPGISDRRTRDCSAR